MCIEEYLQGYLHKLKFRITKIVPNRMIEYGPLFPLSIIAMGNRTGGLEDRRRPCSGLHPGGEAALPYSDFAAYVH
ncbi:hypothetical protein ES703_100493 [subsurface metagenome]